MPEATWIVATDRRNLRLRMTVKRRNREDPETESLGNIERYLRIANLLVRLVKNVARLALMLAAVLA